MRIIYLYFYIPLLVFLLTACSSTGTDGTPPPLATFQAVAEGQIVKSNGEPLPGVSVLITSDSISYGSEYTDEQGYFKNHLIQPTGDTLQTLYYTVKPLEHLQIRDSTVTLSLNPNLIFRQSTPLDTVRVTIVF